MVKRSKLTMAALGTLALLAAAFPQAHAATCGSSAAGFETWKQEFSREAQAKGREKWYSAFRTRIALVERDYGL